MDFNDGRIIQLWNIMMDHNDHIFTIFLLRINFIMEKAMMNYFSTKTSKLVQKNYVHFFDCKLTFVIKKEKN